ncbi:alpha/beta fold hydrolase [Pseudonocardia sp. CA-142604]|uniref:alpha/beta fold hydrolase n=1 Tax=Pseudonocardia sp. CA-142604 TaxID=3240024 RepID=UPI003D92962A
MTISATHRIHRLDGRRVAVHDLTPDAPAGAPVVLLCHAAPGSGAFDPDPEATAARGIRLISFDRPGYGGSDPVGDGAFATVDGAADDAAALLETILEPGATAAVAGWSAGGRVALALAARRPDLVSRVAVIGTPAPDEDVHWIPEEHRAGIEALRDAPAAVAHEALGAAFAPVLAALSGDARFGLVGIDEADGPVLAEPGVADRLRAMLDEALAQGGAGLVADIAGYTLRPWGFDPADVKASVLLSYGSADHIGQAHGLWWHRALPDARLDVVDGAGHLVVVPRWKALLAFLCREAV